MARGKFLYDVSISTAQAVLNQLTGVVLFLVISKYLDKTGLGYMNWVMAVLLVAFSVLGFGLEQVAVKKAATGGDIRLLVQSYLFHVLFTGTIFLLLLCMVVFMVPSLQDQGWLLVWLAVSQCLSFFAVPFRQIANGLEQFRVFFWMSSCANGIKMTAILLLAIFKAVSLPAIALVYGGASLIELVTCIILFRTTLGLPVSVVYHYPSYIAFLKEALPQLGINIFNMAMQRMDWILLGILSTVIMVAEYSFTNRLFELAMLPLFIAAPVIFPKIAKLFGKETGDRHAARITYITILVKIEMIVSVFVALVVNLCWKEVINFLTDHKYGDSTRPIILILSFGMPLVYLNNIFWSLFFAQEKMRLLFYVFLVSFSVNMVADLFLIPLYQARGAAIGFVAALFAQSTFYFVKTGMREIRRSIAHIVPVIAAAVAAGFLALYLTDFFVTQVLIAAAAYCLFLYGMKQFRSYDWDVLKKLMTV